MYADQTFYKTEYFGKVIADEDLDSFLSKASDSVDQLTMYKINERGGFDQLTPFQQKAVKMAVCEQADFLSAVIETPEWVQSYSVGSVSVSKNIQASTKYSPRSIDYLRATNLMYRGLGS